MPAEPLVAGRLRERVQCPLDVLGERRREAALELLEGGREVGVVLVGVADHQPCRQHDGHRLLLGQLEGRQKRLLGVDAPQPVLTPDGQAELLLERNEIAIDGADGDGHPLRDVGRADAVGMGFEDRHEPSQPGEAVSLGAVPLPLLGVGHGPGG